MYILKKKPKRLSYLLMTLITVGVSLTSLAEAMEPDEEYFKQQVRQARKQSRKQSRKQDYQQTYEAYHEAREQASQKTRKQSRRDKRERAYEIERETLEARRQVRQQAEKEHQETRERALLRSQQVAQDVADRNRLHYKPYNPPASIEESEGSARALKRNAKHLRKEKEAEAETVQETFNSALGKLLDVVPEATEYLFHHARHAEEAALEAEKIEHIEKMTDRFRQRSHQSRL